MTPVAVKTVNMWTRSFRKSSTNPASTVMDSP